MALAFSLTVLLCGCVGGNDAALFVGTWDLRSGHNGAGSDDLSEENVSALRNLGVDAYLDLGEDGALTLVMFDEAKGGNWKATGPASANATIEGQSATISLVGDELRLKQQDAVLEFFKGNSKEANASLPAKSSDLGKSQALEARLSELVVRGALWDAPVTVADDARCTVQVNGVGTDRLGDPGFNLQITNNGEDSIDVWVCEPFRVDGAWVKVYLCETVAPRETATAFMQFDTADLHSTSPSALQNVQGELLVDDADNVTVGRYPFEMKSNA